MTRTWALATCATINIKHNSTIYPSIPILQYRNLSIHLKNEKKSAQLSSCALFYKRLPSVAKVSIRRLNQPAAESWHDVRQLFGWQPGEHLLHGRLRRRVARSHSIIVSFDRRCLWNGLCTPPGSLHLSWYFSNGGFRGIVQFLNTIPSLRSTLFMDHFEDVVQLAELILCQQFLKNLRPQCHNSAPKLLAYHTTPQPKTQPKKM